LTYSARFILPCERVFDEEVIRRREKSLHPLSFYYLTMSRAKNPFGDGFAAQRIVRILAETL